MITAGSHRDLISSIDRERLEAASRHRLAAAGRRLARAQRARVRAERRVDRAHASLGHLRVASLR